VATLYERLRDAGCELGSHESDLHVRDTPDARAILAEFPRVKPHAFRSAIDGAPWLDVPFANDPWWAARELPPARAPQQQVPEVPTEPVRLGIRSEDWP
jgi:hypothetical protein